MHEQSGTPTVPAAWEGPPLTELLPRELIIQVASHLPKQDLLHFLRCNSAMHSLLCDADLQAVWLLQQRGGGGALCGACKVFTSRPQLLERLLHVASAQINSRAADGLTPLLAACMAGNWPLVVRLLAVRGIDVNLASSRSCGYTPLIVACITWAMRTQRMHGGGVGGVYLGGTDEEPAHIVAALLATPGIDVHAIDETGSNALHLVCAVGHFPSCKMLAGHPGIDVHARSQGGFTARRMAMAFSQNAKYAGPGHADILKLLPQAPGEVPAGVLGAQAAQE